MSIHRFCCRNIKKLYLPGVSRPLVAPLDPHKTFFFIIASLDNVIGLICSYKHICTRMKCAVKIAQGSYFVHVARLYLFNHTATNACVSSKCDVEVIVWFESLYGKRIHAIIYRTDEHTIQ